MSRVDQSDENRLREACESLARCVCSEQVSPLTFTDVHGPFKLFIDSLNPKFHPTLSLKSLQQDCLKIYEEQREMAKEIFSKLDGRISISVDSPLFEKSWDSYEYQYCINAHFIDNDWKLQNWVLRYYGGGCEFYSIDSVLEALKNWDIEGKILSLTTGEYDIANSVKEDIQGRRELLLNGQLFHVQCSCDIITQMVQAAFEMIDDIIDKVKLLAWSKSLPLWYLTTSKLKSALELESAGEFTPDKINDSFYEIPSEEEWEKVRIICKITDRIYEITKPLYEAKKLTANLFLPHLVEIRSYLAQESSSSDQFAKEVAMKMLKTYTMYWNGMYLMLSIAAFLDPRYKLRFIEFSFSKLRSEENAVKVLETIRKLYESSIVENDEMEYLLSDSSSDEEEDEEEEEEGGEEETDMIKKEKQSENLMEKLKILEEYCSVKSENDLKIKSDLDYYLEEPVIPWTENFSVLNWWKDNCLKYPRLSRMARDFLAVPMSVASSYDAYYTEPRQADVTVASLKPELMNALMCTRSWNLHKYDE